MVINGEMVILCSHYPQITATVVADTPEGRRNKEISNLNSKVINMQHCSTVITYADFDILFIWDLYSLYYNI